MTEAFPFLARLLPLLFGVLFIGGLVGYRAARFQRRYGHSPIHRPAAEDRSAHAFLSRTLVVYFLMILVLGGLVAIAPGALEAVDLLFARHTAGFQGPGIVLALVAGGIVWRAQEDMAASWRIGIEATERTELVTRGLFRFCRNPIYLGLQLGLVAFACLVPGYLTLMMLVASGFLFQVQARLEEAYLLARHGEAYALYCRKVGRFLPFTGRWPSERRSGGARRLDA